MKQIKFNELQMTDKAIILAEYGAHLESMEYYDYWIHLYALHSNFVEVFYNINTKQIDRITIAKYLDLDKYITRIVIMPKV